MKKPTNKHDGKTSVATTHHNKDGDHNNSDISDIEAVDMYAEMLPEYSGCRALTLSNIIDALDSLETSQQLSRKRSRSSDSETVSTKLCQQKTQSTVEYNCCRLVRSDKSSRTSLPLARRGRAHTSSRSIGSLCESCLKIKQKQENEILKKQSRIQHADDNDDNKKNSINIFDALARLNDKIEHENKAQRIIQDLPREIQFSLSNDNENTHINDTDYESAHQLVWKMNVCNSPNQMNVINAAYDTGSLRNDEKKVLLEETIKQLQIALSHRSSTSPITTTTTAMSVSDIDEIEFTYRALQTTVNILSSSLDTL